MTLSDFGLYSFVLTVCWAQWACILSRSLVNSLIYDIRSCAIRARSSSFCICLVGYGLTATETKRHGFISCVRRLCVLLSVSILFFLLRLLLLCCFTVLLVTIQNTHTWARTPGLSYEESTHKFIFFSLIDCNSISFKFWFSIHTEDTHRHVHTLTDPNINA